MKTKRIFAYIIDYFFISFIASLIFMICFPSQSEKYTNKYEELNNQIVNSGSSEITIEEANKIRYELEEVKVSLAIIEVGVTVLYFGFLSFAMNGRTIGKKMLRIQVVPIKGKKLNPSLYLLREIILTNTIFKILAIVNISLCGFEKWVIFSDIITYASLGVIFVLLAVLIFRDDERSLHDIIAKTKVIEVPKKIEENN